MILDSLRFERSLPLHGSPFRLLNLAQESLDGSGFRLMVKGPGFVDFDSNYDTGTNHPIALVASRVRVDASRGQVRLRASLDGLREVRNLLLFVPFGLCLLFLALFAVFFRHLGFPFALFVALASGLPWLVLTLVVMKWVQRRAERALDALLKNLVEAAEQEREETAPGIP